MTANDRSDETRRRAVDGSALSVSRAAVQGKIDEGLQHHGAGRLPEAEALYREVLAVDPLHPDGLHLLGVIADQVGRHDAAAELIRRAIAVRPDQPHYHVHLGAALRRLGKPDEAVSSYRSALAVAPDCADAHNGLGIVLQARGDLDKALASYDRAIVIDPGSAAYHHNRGNVLTEQARFEEAVSSYDRALALQPALVEAHERRGDVLLKQGKPDEARASHDRALAVKRRRAEAHFNQGVILEGQGKSLEALACFDRVLALTPDIASVHAKRGDILNSLGKFHGALASYDRVVALDPGRATHHANRGFILRNLAKFDAAVESFDRARALEPCSFEYACLSKLEVPLLLSSGREIAALRARLRNGIRELTEFPGNLESVEDTGCASIFYLAYHDVDDRSLLEARCRLFRAKAPSLTYEAPHIAQWRPPAAGRRIRIGFASSHFQKHTISKLYLGFLRELDRNHFEVVVIHGAATRRDDVSEQVDGLAGKSLRLPASLALQHQAIADERFDVLFFPDVGMRNESYFLAYARLAPVQVVGWGHPATSGLDTLDYFVSAAGIEPPDAELQYTEQLVQLTRLPCFYDRPDAPSAIPGRADFGLPTEGTLYGCLQSLFKFHPDFDALLAGIAAGDPRGHIVLMEGLAPSWRELLQERWARSHPELVDRVHFLPQLPPERFMALMAHFDVLLDTIHFGSGNTLYEAMLYGTPIVTWPGHFMRGRIVAGAYGQMGIADAPIAQRLADYVPLALALGRDSARRASLRRACREASAQLFSDRQAVREFEAFFEAAVEAAGANRKLPSSWRPSSSSG